ncbi:MAG: hypothetical protein EXR62_07655 [Chloroflexi bacterium]|nr:hypothetical protein [Chloroflexota bacterium]
MEQLPMKTHKHQVIFSARKRRIPMMQRAPIDRLPPSYVTKRDIQIIQAVYECRALTTTQIEALFFTPPGQRSGGKLDTRCQYRLQMLFHKGYLFRDEQPVKLSEGRKPLVYFLDTKGAALLASLSDRTVAALGWQPRDNSVRYLFLEHLLASNDIRIAITVEARKHGWIIEEWRDEKQLKSPQMKDIVTITGPDGIKAKAVVVPDGYFRLQTQKDAHHYFLETDMRTVTGEASVWGRRDWARKVRAYLTYYASGLYRTRYHTADMRILVVTTGEGRLANLKRVTEKAGGRGRFWFTTFDHITTGNILTHPLWQVASRNGFFSMIGDAAT